MQPFHVRAPAGVAPSFIASPVFARALLAREFPTLTMDLENVAIDGQVLRLPVVKEFLPRQDRVITARPFMDYHEPLPAAAEIHRRAEIYVPCVALEVVRVHDDGARWDTGESKRLQPAPFVQLDEFTGFEDYRRQQLSDSRYKDDARRRRQAEKALGPITFQVHDPLAIRQAFEWKRLQFPGNSDLGEAGCSFLESMADDLVVSTLRDRDHRLLAVWIGYIHAGVWGGWIFSIDPDPALQNYSLGRQLLYSMIEEAFRRGCRQFDFSIGGELYKYMFATHVRLCGSIGTPTLADRLLTRTRWSTKLTWLARLCSRSGI